MRVMKTIVFTHKTHKKSFAYSVRLPACARTIFVALETSRRGEYTYEILNRLEDFSSSLCTAVTKVPPTVSTSPTTAISSRATFIIQRSTVTAHGICTAQSGMCTTAVDYTGPTLIDTCFDNIALKGQDRVYWQRGGLLVYTEDQQNTRNTDRATDIHDTRHRKGRQQNGARAKCGEGREYTRTKRADGQDYKNSKKRSNASTGEGPNSPTLNRPRWEAPKQPRQAVVQSDAAP